MANKRTDMSKQRQLLRLYFQGEKKLTISTLTGVSRNTLKKYLRIYHGLDLSIKDIEMLSDKSLDELIGMLVEAEWDDRQMRNLERRLLNARFRYQSSIASIDYSADRNLGRGLLLRFAECGFIIKHENIIITGSTGIGKSYIATEL